MGIWDIVLALFTYELLIILAGIALFVVLFIIEVIIDCIVIFLIWAKDKFKKNEK